MTVSIASSIVASAGSVTIAMRGTITSWMRWSPSSMTAWIICSSSASRMPCSPPRSTRIVSSSVLITPCAWSPAPSIRATVVVIAVRTRTSGPRTRSSTSMKPLSRSAKRSVWARARLLGTSSPKTIVNRLRRRVTMISASGAADVLTIGQPGPLEAAPRGWSSG